MARCDICNGRGKVRLPVYREASVRYDEAASISPAMDTANREYPCPECSPRPDVVNVELFRTRHDIDSRIPVDARERYVRDQAAHMMAEALKNSGHLRITVGQLDTRRMCHPVNATLGVVSQSVVASMEARIAEKQAEVATQVVDLAIDKISHWGSHYGHTMLHKEQAYASLREALKQALESIPSIEKNQRP